MISDFPLGAAIIYGGIDIFAYVLFDRFSFGRSFTSFLIFFFATATMLTFTLLHYEQMMEIYDEKLEKIVIPEFIENRPFKETNLMEKDEKLGNVLRIVNMKFLSEMNKEYTIGNIEKLVKFHDKIIARFLKRYFEAYKDLPLKDIQGWDRILLIAKNIQDEDMKDIYADLVSPDIAQKYSNIRPTTNKGKLKHYNTK